MKYSQITYNDKGLLPELGFLIDLSKISVDFNFNSKSFIQYHFLQITNFCVFERLYVVSNKAVSYFDKFFACYQPNINMSMIINSIGRIVTGNHSITNPIMDNSMDNPKRLPNFIEYSRLFISDESRFEVNQLLKKYTFSNVYN